MKKFLLLAITLLHVCASTLHMSMGASPSRINPILSTDSASSQITAWIFNSLITYDKDAKIKLELAESYRFIDDVTLEFKLKKGVKWSDGAPFSAKDVLFTYETIISPDIFTPYASSFTHIDSVDVLDDYTIHVKYKYPYFKALETWMMSILPQHILKDEKEIMTSSFNQKPIGTGPYTLDEFSISQNIELNAYAEYFVHKANIPKIIYHFVPDPSTQFLMLKTKKLDVGSLSPLQIERQIDEDFKEYYNIYEQISQSYVYMGFNMARDKFKDKRVRQALSYAVDRQELVDVLYFGHGQVCHGPFLPGTDAFNPDVKAPKQDIAKAKALLKEAGYDENNPLEFTVITNTGDRTYAVEVMQAQLRKAGVIMNLRVMEWQAFLNTVVHPRNFDAVLLGWSMGLKPDAYSIWHSESQRKGGFNFVSYKNDEVDRLIKKAEKIVDQDEFNKIYRDIFALIAEDTPYLFLVIPNSITVVNKNISPVEPSIIGVMHNTIDWIKK